MSRRWLRWLPAVAVPAVIAAGVLIAPLQAGALDLPDRSAAQVLELIAGSDTAALSGKVHQSSELGLPELPSTGGAAGADADAASAMELLTGTHDARVYVDGPSKLRVQVLDTLGERDAVRSGSDLWLYSSQNREAVHAALHSEAPDAAMPTPGVPMTPADLARKALAAAKGNTDVRVGDDVSVAGRDAYQLVLVPSTTDTLVGSVRIAVDAQTGVPLRAQVFARGQAEAAFSIGFTSIDLSAPQASIFAFTPPADAKVTEQTLPTAAPKDSSAPHGAAPTITGTGWAAVAALPLGTASAQQSALLDQLTTAVDGGRAVSTSLVSLLMTDDGRVLVGAVPVSRLEAVAAAE